ncbi:MAG: tetratricopeptide repeat protein [Armatimonadota bacterium]
MSETADKQVKLSDVIANIAGELTKKPKDNSLRLIYADLLLENNRLDDAYSEYMKIRNAEKSNSKAITGIARYYELQEKWSLALAEYKTACMRNPGDPGAVMGYMNLAYKLGKLNESIPAIKSLAKTDKVNAAVCYWTVASWLVEKDYWRAQQYAMDAHLLDPAAYPDRSIASAPVYVRAKRFNSARSSFLPGYMGGGFMSGLSRGTSRWRSLRSDEMNMIQRPSSSTGYVVPPNVQGAIPAPIGGTKR